MHARFAPCGVARDAEGQGFLHSAPVTPFRIQGGDDRASHVPGEPPCAYALLYDPGGTDASGHSTRRRGPRLAPRQGLTTCNLYFEAQSHSLGTRCLRFAAPVTRTPRKTRFRLLASSTGRDWLPAGFHRKVSKCYSSMAVILLSQASWRKVQETFVTCAYESAPRP